MLFNRVGFVVVTLSLSTAACGAYGNQAGRDDGLRDSALRVVPVNNPSSSLAGPTTRVALDNRRDRMRE